MGSAGADGVDAGAGGLCFGGKHHPGAAGRGHSYAPTFFTAEDSETTFMADEMLKWLSVRRDLGWFLHGVFLRPHPPVIAPEPYNALYDPASVPMPRRAARTAITRSSWARAWCTRTSATITPTPGSAAAAWAER